MKASPHSIPLSLRLGRFSFSKPLLLALPICLAYLPIAFAFGVSAQNQGIPFAASAAMSLFVYAGASQMIAVGLMAAGQPISVVLLTTFLVNLRLLLLGTAFAARIGHWPRWQRVLFGFELTDESFATLSTINDNRSFSPQEVFPLHLAVHLSWLTGTVLGHQLSGVVMDLRPLGLDFALCGMLIGMSALLIRRRLQVVVACFSAALMLLSVACGLSTWSILLTAISGPTLGLFLEKQWRR